MAFLYCTVSNGIVGEGVWFQGQKNMSNNISCCMSEDFMNEKVLRVHFLVNTKRIFRTFRNDDYPTFHHDFSIYKAAGHKDAINTVQRL